MSRLINTSKENSVIAESVILANSFVDRLIGLLGKQEFPKQTALWISKCSSIHTFFMKFSIDAIFVDKNLIVKKTIRNLKPWRLTLPGFRYDSVFEFQSGELNDVEKGDQLRVVH